MFLNWFYDLSALVNCFSLVTIRRIFKISKRVSSELHGGCGEFRPINLFITPVGLVMLLQLTVLSRSATTMLSNILRRFILSLCFFEFTVCIGTWVRSLSFSLNYVCCRCWGEGFVIIWQCITRSCHIRHGFLKFSLILWNSERYTWVVPKIRRQSQYYIFQRKLRAETNFMIHFNEYKICIWKMISINIEILKL